MTSSDPTKVYRSIDAAGIYLNDEKVDRYNVHLNNVEFVHTPKLSIDKDHEISFGFKQSSASGTLIEIGDFRLESGDGLLSMMIEDRDVYDMELDFSILHLVVIRSVQGKLVVEISRDPTQESEKPKFYRWVHEHSLDLRQCFKQKYKFQTLNCF